MSVGSWTEATVLGLIFALRDLANQDKTDLASSGLSWKKLSQWLKGRNLRHLGGGNSTISIEGGGG